MKVEEEAVEIGMMTAQLNRGSIRENGGRSKPVSTFSLKFNGRGRGYISRNLIP